MTAIVVFVGPTIPASQAREILAADYRGPAKAGDVLAATYSRPKAIVVIDGLFESVPAVWHKEILFALSEGIHVYGASSMGALRAAELHTFGMIGVGKIFDAFCSGALEDDDEVAVIHGPESHGAIIQSEAMVNIREGLERAAADAVISPATRDRLTALGKSLHYPDRSWPAILRLGANEKLPTAELAGLSAFLETVDTNLKRHDAILLLRRVAEDAVAGFAPFKPQFRFERSSLFEALREAENLRRPAGP
jgi:hypothetical protein